MISGFVLRPIGVNDYPHILRLSDQGMISIASMTEIWRLPIKKFVYLSNALPLHALPAIF